MSAPRLAAADVLAIVAANKVPRREYPCVVVAIRGYRLDSLGKPGQNDRGVFDDAIWIVAPDPAGGDMVLPYNGNTDPTAYKHKRATLCTGIHLMGPGMHNVSKGKLRQYPAFRQAEVFTVTRDGFGRRRFRGFFGINLHRAWGRFGSWGGTSSWGCQTIPAERWVDFHDTLNGLLVSNRRGRIDLGLWDPNYPDKPIFPYVLIEETARRAGDLVVSGRYGAKRAQQVA